MTLSEIELLLSSNDITKVIVTPAPVARNKWNILFERKNEQVVPLTATRANIRNFASIDSAVDAIKPLGVSTITVDWSKA